MDGETNTKSHWPLRLIGVAALLWYASGTYTIFQAQAGRLEGISLDEAAYYAAQPGWFVAVTDIALFAGIAGSILLLMRNAKAVQLFVLSLVAIVVTHAYDLAMGTSRSFANAGALTVNFIILAIAVLLIWYSLKLKRQGVLR